jgi:hypothetical protein
MTSHSRIEIKFESTYRFRCGFIRKFNSFHYASIVNVSIVNCV